MPIYEYVAVDFEKGCNRCRNAFEFMQKMDDPPLTACPDCGEPVKKLISRFGITYQKDYLFKKGGLTKLVKKDKGVYEKEY